MSDTMFRCYDCGELFETDADDVECPRCWATGDMLERVSGGSA